jgi:hypothetical protein
MERAGGKASGDKDGCGVSSSAGSSGLGGSQMAARKATELSSAATVIPARRILGSCRGVYCAAAPGTEPCGGGRYNLIRLRSMDSTATASDAMAPSSNTMVRPAGYAEAHPTNTSAQTLTIY